MGRIPGRSVRPNSTSLYRPIGVGSVIGGIPSFGVVAEWVGGGVVECPLGIASGRASPDHGGVTATATKGKRAARDRPRAKAVRPSSAGRVMELQGPPRGAVQAQLVKAVLAAAFIAGLLLSPHLW